MFRKKKKLIEVVYVEENIILINEHRFHRSDHELHEIFKLLLAQGQKLDKIYKAVAGSVDDGEMRQNIYDGILKLKQDIESTV